MEGGGFNFRTNSSIANLEQIFADPFREQQQSRLDEGKRSKTQHRQEVPNKKNNLLKNFFD
jgi:hypothetical protein